MIENTPTKEHIVVNGTTYNVNEVQIVDVTSYICDEYLSPLYELFQMMHERDAGLASPMGTAGRIGLPLASSACERFDAVFHFLKQNRGTEINVILASSETPGERTGTILDVQVVEKQEV